MSNSCMEKQIKIIRLLTSIVQPCQILEGSYSGFKAEKNLYNFRLNRI